MTTPERDVRLRELAAEIKATRQRWEKDPTVETGRTLLALQDAEYARYLELVRTDLEKAKAKVTEARAAVTAGRDALREAGRGLVAGESGADAVLAADDALTAAKRALRLVRVEEGICRTRLAEAVLARWGPDAVEAAIGLPLRVSVSPSAGAGLREALLGDVG